MDDRADIVLAGDVGGGEDGDDAGRGADRVEVERQQPGMAVGGDGRRRGGACPAARAVVDIERAARDMELGAVVRQRLVDGALSHGAR